MVFRGRHGSASYILSLKPHSLAVSRQDALVVSWDMGGRLYSVSDDIATWRRGLDGRVLEKRRDGHGLVRRFLEPLEADALVTRAADLARELLRALSGPAWTWDGGTDPCEAPAVAVHLDACSRFTAAAAAADAARFGTVYRPVGILPPDQYLTLVVQATEGCSFNTCTFCDLHHDGYRVKSVDEFAAHVGAVRAYLGASASLRSRGIFLGAANALAVPMKRLAPMFEILVDQLDAVRKGVFAFVDGFTGAIKTVSDYRLLGHLGLRRVYVGLESGHDPLLAFVRKPGTAAHAVDTVCAIKAAGLQAGVIVMTGLGGERFSGGHVTDTILAVRAMGLGPGDLIYFSDLVEVPGTSYPRMALAADAPPLGADRRRQQRDAIRAGVQAGAPGAQFATYDTREFIY